MALRTARSAIVTTLLACGGGGGGGAEGSTTGESSGEGSGSTGEGSGEGSSDSGSDDGGPANECSLCEQDCPDGEKCTPAASEMTLVPEQLVCAPVDPDAVGIGEACQIEDYYGAGRDNCEEGTFCVLGDVESLTGYCQQTCCPDQDPDGCPPDEVCEAFFDGVEDVPPVPLCMPECDPLYPDSCAQVGRPGWSCIPSTLGAACEFLCVPPTPVPDGELGDQGTPCLFWSDCKPGLHCQPPEVVGCDAGDFGYCCTAFCDVGGPDTCPDGLVCEPFACLDPTWDDVGACVLPGGRAAVDTPGAAD